MRRISPATTAALVLGAFLAGFLSHLLYQRWRSPATEGRGYAVTLSPLPPPSAQPTDIPLLQARDVPMIKALAGQQARVRGRVYRVGHSPKSNTYFLNFGPSQASLTGVIFASALESFEKSQIHPKSYEGRDVELTGEIRDHPKYGLEIILEDPRQVRVFD